MKKTIFSALAGATILALSAIPAFATVDRVPGEWDVSGSYVVNVEYLGTDYPEDLVLTQTGTGITGASLNTIPPAAGSAFTVTEGSVVGNEINIYADHDTSSLEVHLQGTIADDGSMEGGWADEAPGTREGTWETTSGTATRFEGNHGQYVSSQNNKKEAAQSRIGMPSQSKGHTKSK